MCKCTPDKPSTKHPTFMLQLVAENTKYPKFEYGPSQYFQQQSRTGNRDIEQDC